MPQKERLAAVADTGPSAFTPEAEGIRQMMMTVPLSEKVGYCVSGKS